MSDQVDFQLVGEDLQAVVVTLDPGEAVVAEAGAFTYMQDGIEMATQLSMSQQNKGIFGRLFEAGKRVLTGDSFFITFFTNNGSRRAEVAFSAPYPGRIVPLEIGEIGGTIIAQKDCFLCGARGIEVSIALTRRIGAGLFGGEGFILQKIFAPSGRGLVFLHAGGMVIERTLAPGESLRVDTGCLVAFEPSVDYDIQMVPGIRNKIFGGEGLFYVQLRGPGRVWLQTLPFSRLADRIFAAAPSAGGSGREEGSILGGIGRVLDGDR
jgi:uncharacterized protein (TIGR00266 family)